MRSTIKGLTPRVRATANPEGQGLWWVKKRFVSGIKPKKTHFFIADENPETNPQGIQVKPGDKLFEQATSRVFIPMFLRENKLLQDSDPAYASRIRQLGSRMAKALLDGDWDAFGGEFFAEFDRGKEIVEPFFIPTEWRLILSIDPGYSSPCSAGINAVDEKGRLYRVATYYERMRNPEQNAEGVRRFIKELRWTRGRWPEMVVMDPSGFAKRDKFAVRATEKSFADVFEAYDIFAMPGFNDRIQGWWMWRNLMPGRYFVFKGLNEPLLDEMTAAIPDEKAPEDLAGRGNDSNVNDHALDEQRYAVMAAFAAEVPASKDRGWEYQLFKRKPQDAGGYYVGAR